MAHAAVDPEAGAEQTIRLLDARYRSPLMSFFLRRMSSPTEAEDLTQEVFLRIVRRPDLANAEIVDGFIFTVAANLLRDRSRRARARAADRHASLDDSDDFDGDPALVDMLNPERMVLSREALDRALAALEAAGPRTRDIFLLYRFEGMKQREIAQVFGMSVSAVEKQVAKAIELLTRELRAGG